MNIAPSQVPTTPEINSRLLKIKAPTIKNPYTIQDQQLLYKQWFYDRKALMIMQSDDITKTQQIISTHKCLSTLKQKAVIN